MKCNLLLLVHPFLLPTMVYYYVFCSVRVLYIFCQHQHYKKYIFEYNPNQHNSWAVYNHWTGLLEWTTGMD